MRIAIIGCGVIGSAFAKRLYSAHELYLYDRKWETTKALATEVASQACLTLEEAVKSADWIILTVKPQNLNEVANQMGSFLKSNQLLISSLAGIPLKQLNSHFPTPSILRLMPNLAVMYGQGVIGMTDQNLHSPEVKQELEAAFSPLGKVYWIPESKMDAFTSLTGSGPAFAFILIEAMIDAGIAMGFHSHEAQELVYQMLQGSLALLKETGQHPDELKWKITSPAGMTIAGIRHLENEGVRGKIMNAFIAAYERASQLKNST